MGETLRRRIPYAEDARLSLGSLGRRAQEIVEREGVRALAARALRRASSTLVEVSSVRFFVRDLHDALPDPPVLEGVELREGTLEDLERHREGFDPSQSPDDLRARLRRGHRCLLAIGPDGTAVHTRWVSTGRAYVSELEADVLPRPGEAYFYNGFTRPDCRGRGVDGLVRCLLFRKLKSEGFRRAYSYVRGNNTSGLKAAERWQRPAGRLWYLRLRGSKRPLVTRRGYDGPPLLPRLSAPSEEAAERNRLWRAWFEGFVDKPLSMRSTGYHDCPETYFVQTADWIAATLALDADADLVLDLGCDSAMITRHLAPRCRRVLGIDLIPGMLADGARMNLRSASGAPVAFLAGNGVALPVRSNSVDKAYCTGVLQTLPSREHGLSMIDELVRVTVPGGTVLVGAVPDVAKRRSALAEAWSRSDVRGKLRLAASLAVPGPLKRLARRLGGPGSSERLLLLDYDLRALKLELEARGLSCTVVDFPPDYWSRDFRRTRSNLCIRLPQSPRPLTPEGARA